LLEYLEPNSGFDNNSCEIRVDSGVVPGGIISQFYDPMISKLIAYSPKSRSESIEALNKALDNYVIKGIKHNISFLSDVLRHESFMNGETPTDFIDKHYPDGFSGVELSVKQCTEIAAIAAKASFWRGDVLQRPPNSLHFVEEGDEEEFQTIVCLGGMFGSPYLVEQAEDVLKVTPHDTDESHSVQVEGVEMGITFPIMDAFVNGEEKTFQISNEDNTGSFSMTYEGATFDVIVMSLKEYELCSHMKEPRKLDTSNKILSPMPGTLISYSVEVSLR
jgi:propionyl-CoA carboxylase alpha chain